jgi:hypothetical protein
LFANRLEEGDVVWRVRERCAAGFANASAETDVSSHRLLPIRG